MDQRLLVSSRFAVLPLLLCSTAFADVVVLKSGWEAEGRVTETADQVVVKLKTGLQVTYPRRDVERIIRKETPRQAFQRRFAAVSRQDLASLQELATWCRTSGLGPEAAQVAQAILDVDPGSAFAKGILIRHKMVAQHIPPNRERELALAQEFGKGFHIYRSRHYRVCYNTDPEYAKERASNFERLYEQFYRHFDKLGMPMAFLADRVEIVLFRSHDQYAAYAGSKFPALVRSAGVYLQQENRAVFFDGKGDDAYRASRQQYASHMRNLQGLRRQAASMDSNQRIVLGYSDGRRETLTRSGLKSRISRLREQARAQWKKIASQRQSMNLVTTMHECTHQLAFNLGIHPRQGRVPKWLAEGIATYFEESRPERRVQAKGLNKRLAAVYRSRPDRPGLRELLTHDAVWAVFNSETQTAYAQAWALFRFLSAKRQPQLVAYLKQQVRAGAQADTSKRRVADFERAFGPLAQVEQEWRAFAAGVADR